MIKNIKPPETLRNKALTAILGGKNISDHHFC